jgi:hypothetical protein
MTFRTALPVLLSIALVGCETPYKKTDKKEAVQKHDQSADTSFNSFLGRLRIAARNKDLPMLASLMSADFGYRWDTPPEGDNVFTYWDQHKLWGELNALLKEKFIPSDDFMVSPPQVVADPDYRGYRMGLRLVNGSWRFAYFVSGEVVQ